MVQLASANGSTAMSEAVNTKIRVFVVDDHLIIRRGLSLIVKDQQDMVLVGEASDGWEAVESITSMKPDVVLMDIELPGISGVEATKKISESNPNTAVLILTSHEREDLLFQSLRAGAAGYTLKSTDSEDLLAAIRTVNAGEVCISPSMASKLVGDYLDRSGNPEGIDTYSSLSNREREVLPLLAEGHSHQTIATKLQVSPFTVQTYRQRIMRKLDIHSGTDLLRYALRKGLVSLEA
jgi:two-component system response regulator NreC